MNTVALFFLIVVGVIVTIGDACTPTTPAVVSSTTTTTTLAPGRRKRDIESAVNDNKDVSIIFEIINLNDTVDLLTVVKAAFIQTIQNGTLKETLQTAFKKDPLFGYDTNTETYQLHKTILPVECNELKQAAKDVSKKDFITIAIKC